MSVVGTSGKSDVVSPELTQATAAAEHRDAGSDLFENGLPRRTQNLLGVFPGRFANIGRRAIVVVSVMWLPLLVLAVIADIAGARGALRSFVTDARLHANFLIAAPILVFADLVAGRRLGAIVSHFGSGGLVADNSLPDLRRLVRRARRSLEHGRAEIAILAVAYSVSAVFVFSHDFTDLTAWHLDAGRQELSLAGWWHLLISLPLFLSLVFGWFWRLAVWGWLLAGISRLDLRINHGHPDRAGGLAIVGYSLRALMVFGFAIGVVGAGYVADAVLRDATSLTQAASFAAVLSVFTLLLCSLPVLTFSPRLLSEWWKGVVTYNALASRLGHAFENRWTSGRDTDTESALKEPDFSSVADFYQIVANVHAIRPVPVDFRSIAMFVIATLLPFVPVVFLAIPASTIFEKLRSLVL